MDISTLIFIGYVLFAVIVIYTLLFGESNFHKNGLVGKLNRFMTTGLWVYVRRIGPKICGRKVYTFVSSLGDWLWNKPNPIMQIFYLFLVVGGSGAMMWFGYPFVPGPYLSSVHLVTFPAFLIFVVGFFIFTSNSNPGRITKENWEMYNSIFPIDNVIYGPGTCRTCQHGKVARSKHCSICGQDTARYDHHCPWINNCVGLLNLRYFLLFLFFTGLIINYVTYLSSMILVGIIEKERLWFYQDARGRVLETPYSYIFQYLVYAAVPILALFLFTVFIGVVVYGFLGYHLWLISRGTTTNETFKWQDFEEDQQLLKKQQQKRAKNSSIPVDDFEDEFADLPLVKAKPITNIYHRGVFKNFSEVFFPLAEETRHPASSFPPSPAKTSAAPNALPKMPLKHENKKRR